MITLNQIITSDNIKGIHPKDAEKVNIKIELKNGEFWEKDYNRNVKIQNIVDDFKVEYDEEIIKEYINEWKNQKKNLKMTDEIQALFKNEGNKIKPIVIGKKSVPDIIGKPFNNPFEIFAFSKKDKILKIQKYDKKEIQDKGLNDFSSSSAYCNGNNYLFISGGINKDNEILNKLWLINLETQKIELKEISPKKNHSMLYIEGNYVLVVGGNDLKTFFYDIEKNEVNEWADLNKKRTEPALIVINNDLYCFDNVNSKQDSEDLTFEKTSVTSGKWEIINPKMDSSFGNLKFNQKFFGVLKGDDEHIIFIGGNMDDEENMSKTNYKYNIFTNTIEDSEIPFKEYNFKEKTFIPYKEEKIDYILPDFNRHHPEVIFYQRNRNKLSLVKYEPNFEINIKNKNKPVKDYKFNFNMPSISLPTTENINNKENININLNNPKLDIKDNIDVNLNLDINNKEIKEIPSFKPPEIEINKPDTNINMNISNLMKESEKIINDNENEIKMQMDININDKGSKNIIINPGDINAKMPEIKTNLPNLSNPSVDVNKDNGVKLRGDFADKINVEKPELDKVSDININNQQGNIEVPDIKTGINLNDNEKINEVLNLEKKLNDINFNIQNPEIKLNSKNINIQNSDNQLIDKNINFPEPNIKLKNKDFNIPNSNINLMDANIKIPKPNIKLSNENYNLENINIHLPKISSELETKIDKIKFENNQKNNDSILKPQIIIDKKKIKDTKKDFYLSGIIMGINQNDKDINLHGDLPEINVGQNMDLKGSNVNANLRGQNINLNRNANINVKDSNINIPSGKLDINGPEIIKNINGELNLNGQKINSPIISINSENKNYFFEGIIAGINSKEVKLNISSTNHNINEPKINSPEIKSPDININIPNIGKNKIDVNSPNVNADVNLNKIDVNANHKITDSYMSGTIVGINSSKIYIPDINLQKPNLKTSNFKIEGKAPELDFEGSKINLPSGKVDVKFNKDINGNIQGMNLIDPNINIEKKEFGIEVPKVEVNPSKINLDNHNIEINGPKIDKNKEIPEINFEKNIEPPSADINFKGNNFNQKMKVNENLSGIKIDAPKIDVKGPNLNINGNKKNHDWDLNVKKPDLKISQNIETSHDYYLTGIIPGLKNSNISDISINSPGVNIDGNIKKSNINVPNFDINPLKANSNFSGTIPGINVKGSKINIPSKNLNIKGPEFNPNINVNLQTLNVEGPEIKGSNPNISGNFEGNLNVKGKNMGIEGNVPGFKLESQKIDTNNPSVNIKESKSNSDYYLSGFISSTKDKNNQIIQDSFSPNTKIHYDGPNINMDNNMANFHGSIHNKEKDDEIKGSRKLLDGNEMNINIDMPYLEIDKNLNVKDQDKIEIEGGNSEGGINLLKTNPTKLQKNINIEDNKFGINVNIDGGIKNESINSNNLGMKFVSDDNNNNDNDTKVLLSSNMGGSKMKKGLPMVGVKSSNFVASKVDAAGKFDVDNINIDNMKSANVGVNGQKLGDRIEE